MCRRIIILIIITITALLLIPNYSSYNFEENRYINVEVKGEVKQEKIINLPLGSNISDLLSQIELTDNSDLSTISKLDVLYNNEILVIPRIKEYKLISINSADINDLVKLDGIGESLAQRIINYRNENGSFICLEDLMNVKGIGENKFNKIRDYICL